MQDELIQRIAGLMAEQSAAYAALSSLTAQLSLALTTCDPARIENLSRTGENELFRMRSRLLEITSALTDFADLKQAQTTPTPIDPEIRERFEKAANELLDVAREFPKVSSRASSLAIGGSSYVSANIQMCGVPPTTYMAPVLKYKRAAAR